MANSHGLYQPYARQHANPEGPGDRRPTAIQIVKDAGVVNKWSDKVILITGCSSGLGVETARALHATGATLFLTVRDEAKGKSVVADIMKSSTDQGAIQLLTMDLADFSSIRSAAADFLTRAKQLNILIANAGVVACVQGKTTDGFETHIGTNHFGHFLLFQLLKQALLDGSSPTFQSRVIVVSSSGHRASPLKFDDLHFDYRPYDKWLAYGQSKTANVHFASSIEHHFGSRGVHAWALHPGVIFDTEALRYASEEDIKAMGGDSFGAVMKTQAQGAATQVWAAISPELEGRGGKYLSDVGEAEKAPADEIIGGPGYGRHAFDDDSRDKLWALSSHAVGSVDLVSDI